MRRLGLVVRLAGSHARQARSWTNNGLPALPSRRRVICLAGRRHEGTARKRLTPEAEVEAKGQAPVQQRRKWGLWARRRCRPAVASSALYGPGPRPRPDAHPPHRRPSGRCSYQPDGAALAARSWASAISTRRCWRVGPAGQGCRPARVRSTPDRGKGELSGHGPRSISPWYGHRGDRQYKIISW